MRSTSSTIRYWAAARSAAGVTGDDLIVDGPITLSEIVRRSVDLHPGTRLARRAADLLDPRRRPAGRHRGPGVGARATGLLGRVPAALRGRLSHRSSPHGMPAPASYGWDHCECWSLGRDRRRRRRPRVRRLPCPDRRPFPRHPIGRWAGCCATVGGPGDVGSLGSTSGRPSRVRGSVSRRRCCSSPPPSVPRAAPPGAPSPRWPRSCRGRAPRDRRRAPPRPGTAPRHPAYADHDRPRRGRPRGHPGDRGAPQGAGPAALWPSA